MPDYLHRTTKNQLNSIASADLPEATANYIEYPDYSAVAGQPSRYWIITGDAITLADQPTRDAIDLAAEEAEKDGLSGNIDRTVRALIRALNDGSFVPNSNYTKQERRNIIRSKL